MMWGQSGRALRLAALSSVVLAAALLGGCNTTQLSSSSGARGASVAFDSIDGPPPDVFQRLVRDLNAEAQARQLTIASRNNNAAYRVRGYLGAQTSKNGDVRITWLWDVYDADQQRVQRINGEEKLTGKHRNAWDGLDEAVVRRIARNSIEKLAVFLTTPDARTQDPEVAFNPDNSPEAAGIVRISNPEADPVRGPQPGAQTQRPRPITVAQDTGAEKAAGQ